MELITWWNNQSFKNCAIEDFSKDWYKLTLDYKVIHISKTLNLEEQMATIKRLYNNLKGSN